jgi:hypothetical protein
MRYRDLEFGIFLTRDPAGFIDGPNVYTYVRQNPWTAFDPLGLWIEEVFAASVSAAGRMVSDVGHGVAQAGIMVEIVAKAAMGGDTSQAYTRLESVTNHAESFGQEISTSNAQVYGADVNSETFENTELIAGVLIPEPGSKVKAVSKADDLVTIIKKGGSKLDESAEVTGDTARSTNKLTREQVAKEQGSYTNLHESGAVYDGKGSRKRSQDSGKRIEKDTGDKHVATEWNPTSDGSGTHRRAYKDESEKMDSHKSHKNHNKKESPGKKYRQQDGEEE